MADTVIDVPASAPEAPVETGPAHAIRIRGTAYPVVLPKLSDPRMVVAATTISVHVLGQLGLHFQVSVPQILAAMLTAFVLGVAITFRETKSFVWPGSALLTGSGIALILRVPDTPLHDHWTFHKWYVFAGVSVLALLIKQLVQYRGHPLFNPSNVALVLTFLVLGSSRVAPLDFWWAPLNGWMIAAYAIIVVGGTVVTRRMHLFAMTVTFWVAFSLGLSVVARSGHCITANWAFAPVCGSEFWRVVVTSPELFIFMYFMITDPKTVPTGRVGRVLFALLTAATCVLLMAPQTTEFGSKVALLGGLTLMCAIRPLLDRFFPVPGSAGDGLRRFAAQLTHNAEGRLSGARIARVAGATLVAVAASVGVLAVGRSASHAFAGDTEDVIGRVPHAINPATFPAITVEQGVLDWNHSIAGSGAQAVVLTLAENLELENQALLRNDPKILVAVDHGDRLDAMNLLLEEARTSGTTVVRRYRLDHVNVTLIVPFGRQDGLSLGLQSTGTLTRETYDSAGHLQRSTDEPFATTFVLRRATGGRWLNVAELPITSAS